MWACRHFFWILVCSSHVRLGSCLFHWAHHSGGQPRKAGPMEQMHQTRLKSKLKQTFHQPKLINTNTKSLQFLFWFWQAKNLWKRQRFPEFAGKSRYANYPNTWRACFFLHWGILIRFHYFFGVIPFTSSATEKETQISLATFIENDKH